MIIDPLLVLLIGIATVIVLIVFLRLNAFIALCAAALVVSFCSPIETTGGLVLSAKVDRVLAAFGEMAGRIGILLAFGAMIGQCMSASGAADRIIQRICALFGEKRLAAALLGSGFVLSIPVFYDVTFYLLLPLAKSVYRSTRRHYLLYLLAIGFGATLSHTLVPPTPGPLLVAETMKIPIGSMIFFGVMIGASLIPFALAIAWLIDRMNPSPEVESDAIADVEPDAVADVEPDTELSKARETALPSTMAAVLPIVLPVLLISLGSGLKTLLDTCPDLKIPQTLLKTVFLLANPTITLMLGALIAAVVLVRVRRLSLRRLEKVLEQALLSAGMIVLITAAGGAFGAMLRSSGVGERIEQLTGTAGTLSGPLTLLLAFVTAAMIKTAQGSSTTAMITASGIFAAMNLGTAQLGFHPGYLAVAIGLGSCVTGWMNDSGFCIFARMSGIGETGALKTWTVGLFLLGVCGLLLVLIYSYILPFA